MPQRHAEIMRTLSDYASRELKSNPKGAAHACSGNSFRGGVSPRFTRRLKGQSTIDYVLIIAIIVLVVLIAGPWVSSAIRNQFNTVAGAIGSGTTGENFYEPEDIPDPQNGAAFVVYSEDDHSLMFYKRRGVPKVGEMFNYRRVTAVYTGFETDAYTASSSTGSSDENDNGATDCPWYTHHSDIKSVEAVDEGIKPLQLAYWFQHFENCASFDVAKFDMSECASISHAFYACKAVNNLDLSAWQTGNVAACTSTFAFCTNLVSLNVSGWDTTGMTSLWYTFTGCESLETLDISSWDCSSISSVAYFFGGMMRLRKFSVPASLVWNSGTSNLPIPSTDYFPDADGKWYAASDGTGYATSDIPSGKADTYFASRALLG